ncbi:accessory gene regulator ArgB-like protein [Metaclostridioides mangenotii]|uniref:accessory gene regulator ArgB-like protein n=1 Tax=Metaclostridioides mangenotii TaxID=1540 RepID=UPI000466FED3|nr:accessory gene regulator B family protein [Clostridioides mangenotii]
MVKSSANKITTYLISKETIDSEDYELYQYAFETIVAFIIQMSVILAIGYMFGRFIETVIFLAFYCPIRQFSGGFHAENYRRCLLVFMILYITNIYIVDKLISLHTNIPMIVITLISYIGISFLAPQEHRHNPLSEKERKSYKRIVMYICSFLLLLIILGINLTITYEYSMYASSVIVCIFIMLVLGIIKRGVTNL